MNEEFFAQVKEVNVNNPVWLGWVFELELINLFRKVSKEKRALSLFNEEGRQLSLSIDSVTMLDDDTALTLTNCTMYLPKKWNQATYDAVYYNISEDNVHNVIFIGATLAAKHDYNYFYLSEFLNNTFGAPGKGKQSYENLIVSMIAVTSENCFPRHKVTQGSRTNVTSVQPYYPSFTGAVQKYFVSTRESRS
jgi:hypothetical protein